MIQILIRFLVGGAVVSLFALIADVLKPKSFAGLFGAAPSVALATLALTMATKGASYAAVEARSMIAGAIAFFIFASLVSWILMRYPFRALWVTLGAMPVWFVVAFGLWSVALK
jgi:hypothetical protein